MTIPNQINIKRNHSLDNQASSDSWSALIIKVNKSVDDYCKDKISVEACEYGVPNLLVLKKNFVCPKSFHCYLCYYKHMKNMIKDCLANDVFYQDDHLSTMYEFQALYQFEFWNSNGSNCGKKGCQTHYEVWTNSLNKSKNFNCKKKDKVYFLCENDHCGKLYDFYLNNKSIIDLYL